MLFNSYEFLLFLLLVLIAHRACYYAGAFAQKLLLIAASLVFYAYWKAEFLILLLGSVGVNYLIGQAISDRKRIVSPTMGLLALGVTANLALLAYFKYATFSLRSINDLFSVELPIPEIVLPLAISFFTFQQIAYLVDAHRGENVSYSFPDYMLFVTFFPHLIAGPLVQPADMMPQFARYRQSARANLDLAVGLTIFCIGLFKKVVIADHISPYADTVFDAAQRGHAPSLIEAHGGVLAYSLQIYFDFSGYSDMAIGLARMFGIKMPLNFFSPYKSVNITEFWRRWHMTLSRLLRDYLYIPLGGSRNGRARRYINLMVTMLLGGLWHGANWTFVIWGALHGIYLIINHAWVAVRGPRPAPQGVRRAIAVATTFAAVCVAWIFFRAPSMESAVLVLKGVVGLNDIVLPEQIAARLGLSGGSTSLLGITIRHGELPLFSGATQTFVLAMGLLAAWFAPNTYQVMRSFRPALDPTNVGGRLQAMSAVRWRPTTAGAAVASVMFVLALLGLTRASPFLYFQF